MALSNRLLVLVLVVAGCSKTPNPAVCCTDPTDCASIGAEEDVRPCSGALTCVDHECVVPDCAMQGCAVTAPVCNLSTNACEGCTSNADCTNFNDQQHCSADSGSCVQCLVATDCGPTVPVCDNNTCRRCERDAECASGACADDGTCVNEASIAYVDPLGDDAGQCTKASPCRTIQRGVDVTSAARPHVVLGKATYSLNGAITMFAGSLTTPTLILHGGEASISGNSGDPIIVADIPVTIRDLAFQVLVGGGALDLRSVSGTNTIERVKIESVTNGMSVRGTTKMRDVEIRGMFNGGSSTGLVYAEANLDLDRVVVHNFDTCIANLGIQDVPAQMKNILVYDCAVAALDLRKTSGLIEFSTFVTEGAGTGPRNVACGSSSLTIRASILWSPGATTVTTGCTLVSTVVGPAAIAGSSNADPQFVDIAADDFHLKTGSPARDAVDMGPPRDVANGPRPVGARFDQGAYEQ